MRASRLAAVRSVLRLSAFIASTNRARALPVIAASSKVSAHLIRRDQPYCTCFFLAWAFSQANSDRVVPNFDQLSATSPALRRSLTKTPENKYRGSDDRKAVVRSGGDRSLARVVRYSLPPRSECWLRSRKPQRASCSASSRRYRTARSNMPSPLPVTAVSPRPNGPQCNKDGAVHDTSRCAASPMRTLVKCCSAKPVSSPSRKRNMPCHIRCRLWIPWRFLSKQLRINAVNQAARRRFLRPIFCFCLKTHSDHQVSLPGYRVEQIVSITDFDRLGSCPGLLIGLKFCDYNWERGQGRVFEIDHILQAIEDRR